MIAPTFKLTSAALFEDRQQPWRSISLPWQTFPIQSMIVDDERAFLHYLASRVYTGQGAIIDMGPLAGGSTYAMATGLSRGHIHSYDLWRYFPGFEAYFGPGCQSLDLSEEFRRNVASVMQFITPHKGDILTQKWTGGPIELMFIDAAKSPALMLHIANEWFPSLQVGAHVVHQDFVSAEDPWIHVAMGILDEFFEVTDSPDGGSVCFRLIKAIPRDPLPANYFGGGREHIRRARKTLPAWHGICLELSEANYLALGGAVKEAKTVLGNARRHPLYDPIRFAYDERVVERALEQAGYAGYDESGGEPSEVVTTAERLQVASEEFWQQVSALIAKHQLTFPEWVGIVAGALKNWSDQQPPREPMA